MADVVLDFKQGDTFSLAVTVSGANSADGVVAKAALDEALAAEPVVALDVSDAQAVYDAIAIIDITGWTITSSVKLNSTLVEELTVTMTTPTSGIVTLSAEPAATTLWADKKHKMDIQFVSPEGTKSSETFYINVVKGVTDG